MIKFLQREIPIMLDLTLEPRTLEIQRAHCVPMGPPKRSRREGENDRGLLWLTYSVTGIGKTSFGRPERKARFYDVGRR